MNTIMAIRQKQNGSEQQIVINTKLHSVMRKADFQR